MLETRAGQYMHFNYRVTFRRERMKPLQTFTLLTHKLPRYQSSINHSLARDCCTVDQWFAICLK
uniref:Uncharacterized protein n=1 Tax=Anguilla anguilla TaxID=7936 RepID=A0A0E9XBI0_ANGAN